MVGAESAQLALAVADLTLELVDQTQTRLDRALPWLRQPEPDEQLATAHAEEIGHRAGLAVGEQDCVHTLLQARAVTHQVQPPTRALALSAYEWVRQPDRRHQVAARELGKHPGVDPVGLAGKRRQPLHLLRISDLDLPAGQLEPIVHKACAVHRLDRGADRLAMLASRGSVLSRKRPAASF
jgi:hypothetical protein